MWDCCNSNTGCPVVCLGQASRPGSCKCPRRTFWSDDTALTAECLWKTLNRFIFISSTSLCFYRTYFESVSLSCEQQSHHLWVCWKCKELIRRKICYWSEAWWRGKKHWLPGLTGREQIQKWATGCADQHVYAKKQIDVDIVLFLMLIKSVLFSYVTDRLRVSLSSRFPWPCLLWMHVCSTSCLKYLHVYWCHDLKASLLM